MNTFNTVDQSGYFEVTTRWQLQILKIKLMLIKTNRSTMNSAEETRRTISNAFNITNSFSIMRFLHVLYATSTTAIQSTTCANSFSNSELINFQSRLC